MRPTYRPDIDGLRAVAVLSVIFYHADISFFGGGFAGVDIFFVISGYLITGLIVSDLASGDFTLRGFWLRRVRRIFPALFFVIAATLVVFAIYFPPQLYNNLGQTVLAQTFFVSNIHFWAESGYFETPSRLVPLLHTWSLSVEEQFYLVYPLLLLACTVYLKRARVIVIAALTLASFAVSVTWAETEPSGGFFLLPSRAWELGIGALLAFAVGPARRKVAAPVLRSAAGNLSEIFSILAIAGIIATVTLYDSETPFPSYFAALPCLSTALLIWANRDRPTYIGRLLAVRPVVYIGLLSYSLYLWHWPVLVLAEYLAGQALDTVSLVIILALSGVFAAISYHLIETPIRRRRWLGSTKGLVVAALLVTGISAGAGGAIDGFEGVPSRLPTDARAFIETAGGDYSRHNECLSPLRHGDPEELFATLVPADLFCRFGPLTPDGRPQIVVWGDSHAFFAHPIIDQLTNEYDVFTNFTWLNGCTANAGLTHSQFGERCKYQNKLVIDYVLANDIKPVLLISRFNFELNEIDPYEYQIRLTPPFLAPTEEQMHQNVEINRDHFADAFEAMVAQLTDNGTHVFVLEQTPRFNIDAPSSGFRQLITGHPPNHFRPRAEIEARGAAARRIFEALEGELFTRLDPTDIFCNAAACSPYDGFATAFRDDDHLSAYGAAMLRPVLEPVFEAAASGRH